MLQLFSIVLFIVEFVWSFIVKRAKQIAQFVVIVGINFTLVVAFFAFMYSLLSLFFWIYEQINYLLNYISAGSSDNFISFAYLVIKSIGLWDGFVDAFKLISGDLVSIFTTYLLRMLLNALMQFRLTVLSLIVASK